MRLATSFVRCGSVGHFELPLPLHFEGRAQSGLGTRLIQDGTDQQQNVGIQA